MLNRSKRSTRSLAAGLAPVWLLILLACETIPAEGVTSTSFHPDQGNNSEHDGQRHPAQGSNSEHDGQWHPVQGDGGEFDGRNADSRNASSRIALKPQAVTEEDEMNIAPISMSDPDGQEMALEQLSVKAAVQGMLSLTELELIFRNPHPRRMEGRFTCTLPEGATISRFAKEVNGRLMEGEVVERLRANRVYDQILHEMRDPALLEQDQGNRFSARVFPIEANATVRLLLSYTRLLRSKDGTRVFSLPLRGLPTMGRFSFHGLFSPLMGEETQDLSRSSRLEGPSSARHSSVQVMDISERNYTPEHDLRVRWRPSARAPKVQLLRAGDFYLASFKAPDMETSRDSKNRPWLFYVDTSASSAEGQAHRIRALESLLHALPPKAKVELYAFDHEVVKLASGKAARVAEELRPALEQRLFLGGTDLETLLRAVTERSKEEPEARVILATDGVATLGQTDRGKLQKMMAELPEETLVHALVLGARQDGEVLRALTRGRGRVVTVPFTESLPSLAADAAESLARPLGQAFEIEDPSAEWLFPNTASDVQPDSEVIVVGKVKAGAMPKVRLEQDGKRVAEVADATTLPMGTFEALLEREGYRSYLAYLSEREVAEENPAIRKALINEQIRISEEHRVLIPRTTLLVLESEEDYARFGLDRRALASILMVGATGIERLDRQREVTNLDKPRPVTDGRPEVTRNQPAEEERAATAGAATAGAATDVVETKEKAEAKKVGEAGPADRSARMDRDSLAMEDSKDEMVFKMAPVAGDDDGDLEESFGGGGAASYGAGAGTMSASGSLTAGGAAPRMSAPASPARLGIAEADSAPERVVEFESREDAAELEEPVARRRMVHGETLASIDGENTEPASEGLDWTRLQPASGEALKTMMASVSENPRDRNAYNQLSDALVGRGGWKDLRQMAIDWQPYDPENPQVYESLGEAALKLGRRDEAIRAFASLVEIAPSKPELLQRAGLLLLRADGEALAESPLRRALELRPDRANAYRHLALILWQQGRFSDAAGVLESATKRSFEGWYGDVQRVIHEELGYVYRAWRAAEPKMEAEIKKRAKEYDVNLKKFDKLRITLAWETDANDVDLHVVDPNGEECYYSHSSTRSGLELYEDITQGFGPEVVRTKKLKKGTYHVGVNYFSSGPMGVSRGVLVVFQPDARGVVTSPAILPFRLIEGGNDMRHLAEIRVKGKMVTE